MGIIILFMNSGKQNKQSNRRTFIKSSLLTAATLTAYPALSFDKDNSYHQTKGTTLRNLPSEGDVVNIAFICHAYFQLSHADVIGTKFFTGFPTDDGMIKPKVKIISMYIEQPGPGGFGTRDNIGARIAQMNGVTLYPTLEDALTLGGDKLAVDGVIYVGEHGNYPYNRLQQKLYPRLNYLERIFRVFDASNRSVPLFTDKAFSYSWLDSMWVYRRAKELNVPMMAGSSAPYWWRAPNLIHPLGTRITEAVGIGYSTLDAYGFHVIEILQCMLERRKGGETGVKSVEGLMGDDVWAAIDSGKISAELVDAACNQIQYHRVGPMREIVKNPAAVIVNYKDETRGTSLLLNEYVNQNWAYAAKADGKTVATKFVYDETTPVYAGFSYLDLNIQRLLLTRRPPVPIERNLLTSCVIDFGIRSAASGKVIETPMLEDVVYNVGGDEPIRPTLTSPRGQSLGPWPPAGYEFIIPDYFKKQS